ncbi:MAG TPA: VOC family protein [Oscillatoriaceae cyanobacterium M33_DOE_052]|uniref:VOC family protein n=1 Tax=Planktothricoides sp. SpSt-374 TaxID=2282167 RepID=A0A7C3ZK77_9CYAN|nr:VOC family protein [Oscillatoriaceae cyanobacterium M33_DOE_052]
MHHVSIRTADIFRAIAFYEQLGFIVSERFTAGITLACWMEGDLGRIELIQVPEPQPAPDPFGDESYTGYYHLSFDITAATPDLPGWLDNLRQRFATAHPEQPLKVLLPPMQQVIGDRVWEVAFIADADGMPLEFIRLLGKINS